MRLSIAEIVEAVDGTLLLASNQDVSASMVAEGVCWDSRAVAAGDMYVALPGERVRVREVSPDGAWLRVLRLSDGATGWIPRLAPRPAAW